MAALGSFEHTKTGLLGDKRDTMLISELQLKPQLGRSLQRGYTFTEGCTFGRPNPTMQGGAGDALRGWYSYYHSSQANAPQPTEAPPAATASVGDVTKPEVAEPPQLPFFRSKTMGPRDFKAMNKAALKGGMVQAHEQYQFRATQDTRLKAKTSGNTKSQVRRLPATMVYGVATRPSTPIYDLLEHRYQDQWLDERRKKEMARRSQQDSKRASAKEIHHTRTSMLRTFHEPVQKQPLWKMPRFENKATPHLSTFRSSGARVAAFKHFSSDGVARRGDYSGGMYEPARS